MATAWTPPSLAPTTGQATEVRQAQAAPHAQAAEVRQAPGLLQELRLLTTTTAMSLTMPLTQVEPAALAQAGPESLAQAGLSMALSLAPPALATSAG